MCSFASAWSTKQSLAALASTEPSARISVKRARKALQCAEPSAIKVQIASGNQKAVRRSSVSTSTGLVHKIYQVLYVVDRSFGNDAVPEVKYMPVTVAYFTQYRARLS